MIYSGGHPAHAQIGDFFESNPIEKTNQYKTYQPYLN